MPLPHHQSEPSKLCQTISRLIGIGLLCLAGASCSCENKDADASAAALVGELRTSLQPLSSPASAPGRLSEATRGYLDYYRIRLDASGYQIGTFESGGETLAAQFYRSGKPGKGTVVIVHGYLDHSGSEANLISHLAGEGYNVAIYDQPGHGLSTGERVSAWRFATYRGAFNDFLDLVSETMPPPYHAIGHSMGGTVLADHMLKAEDSPLQRVILATPMIRDSLPRPVRRLTVVLAPLIEYVPRIPADNSTDETLGPRVLADPLQARCVSSHSARSFALWQWRVRSAPANGWSPLVLNAGIETVIDGEYTDRWLKRTFPKGRHITFEGSRHQLFNEVEPIREKVMRAISEELER